MMRWTQITLATMALLAIGPMPQLVAQQAPAESESAALRTELNETRQMLREQAEALKSLRGELEAQRKQIEALRALTPAMLPANDGPATAAQLQNAASALKKAPAATQTATATGTQPAPSKTLVGKKDPPPADLFFRIGHATFTPGGWIDFTTYFRSTDVGSGLGTNFASIPYNNTSQGALSELRMSAQSSRISMKVDEAVAGMKAYGYLEADFNGYLPGNAYVSTNSNTLRMRVYYMDLSTSKWEVLGGQSWSLITPTRKALSPFLADLFNTFHLDTNYQVGLPYARQTQLRFIYHPTQETSVGISAENPEQYVGSAVALPALFSSLNEVDTNSSSGSGGATATPNLHPDIIAKATLDHKFSGKMWHVGVGGLLTGVHIATPASVTKANRETDVREGGAVMYNLNLELIKGFRLINTGYWSDGGGRYIGGVAPQLVVLQPTSATSPFSAALLHAGSGIGGFEWTLPGKMNNTLLSAYASAVYIQRRYGVDPSVKTSTTYIGYGYPGSPNTNNRLIREYSLASVTTLWRSSNHGSLQAITQGSYVERFPWYVATGAPKAAHTFMEYASLRYLIP